MKLPKSVMGGGAVLLAVLIALTEAMGWPGQIHYAWAALSLIWGLLTFAGK